MPDFHLVMPDFHLEMSDFHIGNSGFPLGYAGFPFWDAGFPLGRVAALTAITVAIAVLLYFPLGSILVP
jgi:hypothetical protein